MIIFLLNFELIILLSNILNYLLFCTIAAQSPRIKLNFVIETELRRSVDMTDL